MKTFLLFISILILSACNIGGTVKTEPLPSCKYDIKQHSSYAYSCVSSTIPYVYIINNYNDQRIEQIAKAFEKAAKEYDFDFAYKDVKIVLTNNSKFYNQRYWHFISEEKTPLIDSEEWNVFENTKSYYQWETSTIYVNLTKERVENPLDVLPHEYTHLASHLNFNDLDKEHSRDILWNDLWNSFTEYWLENNSGL